MKPRPWTAKTSGPSGPDPVELLKTLMKQRKLRSVELAAQLGISKSLLSNILCYQRALSKEVIRKLAARFQVGLECFSSPYNLLSQRKTAKPSKPSPPQKGPRDKDILELLKARTGIPTIARLNDGSTVTIWNTMSSYFIGAQYANISININPAIDGEKVSIFYTSEIGELIDPATMKTLICR